jgi:hypothetical protein
VSAFVVWLMRDPAGVLCLGGDVSAAGAGTGLPTELT